jgi:hypothetical protein
MYLTLIDAAILLNYQYHEQFFANESVFDSYSFEIIDISLILKENELWGTA